MNNIPVSDIITGKASEVAQTCRAQGNFRLAAALDELGDRWVKVVDGEVVGLLEAPDA
jgi:hypothetical protein